MAENRETENHEKELEMMFERMEEIVVPARLMASIVRLVELSNKGLRMNPETGNWEKEVA
jgi:hypothetical protein